MAQAEHYAHRGDTLAAYSLYDWLVGFQARPLLPLSRPLAAQALLKHVVERAARMTGVGG